MPLSEAYEDKKLDAMYGDHHSDRWPATFYVELYTATPTRTGGGTPVTYEGYARVELANDSTTFPDAADGQKPTGVQIDFPTPWETAWKGEWDAGTAYAIGDVVGLGDLFYTASAATTGDSPSSSPASWDALEVATIVAVGAHDHATDDSLAFFKPLADPIDILPGAPLFIGTGALVLV